MASSSADTFCNVCGVAVAPGNMPLHAQGKKHVRLALLKHHRQAEAQRSVYVRGFPLSTTTAMLTTYFNKFGEVTKIFLQKEKGLFAFVEFKAASSVQSVLQRRAYLTFRGQRLTVRQREVKPVSTPLSRAPRRPTDDPPVNPAAEIDQDHVIKALRSAKSVIDQIKQLKDLIGLTEKDIEDRKNIVENLQSVFENRIADCRVHQFGSSVNGFGVRGCDMDLLLDLKLPAPPTEDPASAAQVVLRIEDGPDLKATLTRATLMQRAAYIKKVLVRSDLRLAQLLLIPASRCPIIRFVDADRGVHCDLSVSTGLALQNTQLLQFLCRLDERVQPLVYTLRLFFKSCEISGGASGSQRLSSYALCWVVMTYLQTCRPPILPTIARLAELAEDGEKTHIDGWDCSFTRDPEKWAPSARNNSTPEDLLRGFFKFYSKVNFADAVLCPRDGKVHTVAEFRQLTTVRPGQEDFKFNMVNIQDPFVLSHNVAQNINERLSERLADEMLEAFTKCTCTQFTSPGEDHDWGLTFLISKDRLTPLPTHSNNGATTSKSELTGFDYRVDAEFRPANIPQHVFVESRSLEEVRELWSREVCKLLRETLEQVLLFSCSVKAGEQIMEVGQQVTKVGQPGEQVTKVGQTDEQDTQVGQPREQVTKVGQIGEQVTKVGQTGEQATKVGQISGQDKQISQTGAKLIQEVNEEGAVATVGCVSGEPNSEVIVKEPGSKDSAKAQKRSSTESPPDEPVVKRVCTETNGSTQQAVQTGSDETIEQSESGQSVDQRLVETMDSPEQENCDDQPCTQTSTKACVKDTLLMEIHCSTEHQMWAGRKRVKKALRHTAEGFGEDSMELEKLITRTLKEEIGNLDVNPVLQFDVRVLRTVAENGKCTIHVQMRPTLAPKMFSCFYQFFSTFFSKLIEKSLFR